jgi:GTP:adenosylcobinamide-phosphate guanylyltransferase
MIHYVIEALQAAPGIGEIAVSIDPGAPALPQGVLRLDAEAGPAASTLAAFDRLGAPLLVTTADHPLLTPSMIRDILAAAAVTEAEAVAGICPRATVESAGNPAPRTWIRFSDGAVSGTNLFALATPRAREVVVFWRRIEAQRKRPWRMAWLVGPGTVARYLARSLDREGAAQALGRAAGCSVAFAVIDYPDAAHDVDRPEDLAFAGRRLSARAGSGPDS